VPRTRFGEQFRILAALAAGVLAGLVVGYILVELLIFR